MQKPVGDKPKKKSWMIKNWVSKCQIHVKICPWIRHHMSNPYDDEARRQQEKNWRDVENMEKANRQKQWDLDEELTRKVTEAYQQGAKSNKYYSNSDQSDNSFSRNSGSSITSEIGSVLALIIVFGVFAIFDLWVISWIFPPVGTFIQNVTDPLWYYIADLIEASRK